MLQPEFEVDHVLQRPVHGLLHRGRAGQVPDLLEQVVVDVDEPLSHGLKYIYLMSEWTYQAPAVVIAS